MMFSTNKRSQVWNHFTRLNKNKSKCRHCSDVIITNNGSTSNLARHVKRKHPTVHVVKNDPTNSADDRTSASPPPVGEPSTCSDPAKTNSRTVHAMVSEKKNSNLENQVRNSRIIA